MWTVEADVDGIGTVEDENVTVISSRSLAG